ncbi:MATE family efflux transporter [bacterium]|nr:MATE family efflux transporter [bacterium]
MKFIRKMDYKIARLAIPVIIKNLFHTLVFFVDTVMVGQYGTGVNAGVALAGVGVSGTILWGISMILQGFCMGIVSAVSRSFGEKKIEQIFLFSGTAFSFMLVLSTVVVGIIIFFQNGIISFFNLEPKVFIAARDYLVIMAFGIPFMSLAFVLHSIMQSIGDTVNPMRIVLISNAVNVVLNYILIFGKFGAPEMGISGAAIASVIAQIIQFAAAFIILIRKKYRISFSVSSLLKFRPAYFSRLMKISLPSLIEQLFFQSGYIAFTKIVATLGKNGIAAHRAVLSLESLSFMPAVGCSIAASTLVGQYIGKKKPKTAMALGNRTAFLGLCVLMIVTLFFLLFPGFLISIFSKDSEIIRIGAIAVFIGAFEQPFLALSIIYSGSLLGAGDTRSPMLSSIINSWFIRVPLVYFLVIHMSLGINGVWIGTFFDWAVRGLFLMYVFNKGKWKKIKI